MNLVQLSIRPAGDAMQTAALGGMETEPVRSVVPALRGLRVAR
jgi:hypothetical protein